jgi:peptide/nickel transport system permease protein
MTTTSGTSDPSEHIVVSGYGRNVIRKLSRNPLAMIAAFILIAIVLIAVLAPWITPMDPYRTSMLRRLRPIGDPVFWLGSDELGRDMLSRLMLGGRLSLLIGLTPVISAFVIGSTIGIVAGYVGGWLNTILMRMIDILFAFPSVLLAVALSGALGPGIFNTIVALTFVFIPQIARVAESVTAQIRNRDYVDAARLSGASSLTIVRVQILRNVLGPIFVYTTSLLSVSMILAAGLSFLGLGVRPPEPEWGLMLSTLRSSLYVNPFVAALPGLAIFIVSLSFNILSDGLRSAMEVKE